MAVANLKKKRVKAAQSCRGGKSLYEHKYETLDFDGAVNRLGGKRDKYIGILKSFVELHKDDGVR